jgi:hypothetical protein
MNQHPNLPLEYTGISEDQNVALKFLFLKVFGNTKKDNWNEIKLKTSILHLLKHLLGVAFPTWESISFPCVDKG